MAVLISSTIARLAASSAVAAGIMFGPAVLPAQADITPITLGNGLVAVVGGCQIPIAFVVDWCAQQEALTPQAPLMLDVNPIGTTIVALGAGLYSDGTMRPVLIDRMAATLTLAQQYPATRIITSGGVPQSGVTEARAMRDWLVAHGVAADRIVEEGTSGSTVENANNTARLLADTGAQGVVVVSSPNHVERALSDFRTALTGRIPVTGVISAE